jgi:hypothetical protein
MVAAPESSHEEKPESENAEKEISELNIQNVN